MLDASYVRGHGTSMERCLVDLQAFLPRSLRRKSLNLIFNPPLHMTCMYVLATLVVLLVGGMHSIAYAYAYAYVYYARSMYSTLVCMCLFTLLRS